MLFYRPSISAFLTVGATAVAGLVLSLGPPAAATLKTTSQGTASFSTAKLLGLTATDLNGQSHVLGGSGEHRPVALFFYDPECPISNRYVPRLNELFRQFPKRELDFFAVLSNPLVTAKEALHHHQEYKLQYPVLFDASGTLAQCLQPTHVPEAFVISPQDELLYRGRIDDWFAAVGKPRAKAKHHDFHDAIETVLSGKETAFYKTEPIGCYFEAWEKGRLPESVTYNRDVAPILNAHCVDCHRKGEVAPFALTEFPQAKRRARMLAAVCEDGIMPPWRATKDYGHFLNERHLSPREIALLKKWADTGAPEGNPADLLPPRKFEDEYWRLGKPDMVIPMPVEYEIPADGEDIYRCFVIPLDLPENRMVIGFEFRPGDPAVVHHAIAYLDKSGIARTYDNLDEEPGYSVFGGDSPGFWPSGSLGGWAPGSQPRFLPEGYGRKLEKKEDLVLEIHYHPNGKATRDRSQIGIFFAKKPVKEIHEIVIGTEQINIPAGENDYQRHVWMEFPTDVTLLDVTPHAHYIGKEFKAEATLPNGNKLPLIWIKDWDFRWQDNYVYTKPLRLPKGTRVDTFVSYDNSATNPHNPNDPPQKVTEGWQTTDEMCLFYMTVIPDREKDVGKLWRAAFASFARPADAVE